MSQEEPTLSRAEKKALRDAERKALNKGSKRKHEEQQRGNEEQEAERTVDDVATASNNSRKRKTEHTAPVDNADGETPIPTDSRPKKRRKKALTGSKNEGRDEATDQAQDKAPKNTRFIVFVGNLPYKTSDDTLRAHFKKLEPFTLRHRTDPQTKRSKGFAFLEFENYDRMKTCLKLYHHTMFDPTAKAGEEPTEGSAKKPGKDARKINVELTAGGGGSKAEGRKEKIKAKNVRLEEQRKRRAEVERKENANKEKKQGTKPRQEQTKNNGGEDNDAQTDGDTSQGIHPSRLARMQR